MTYENTTSNKAYFAAANGYSGFRSLFGEIFDPERFGRTFIIKGGMALIAVACFRLLHKRTGKLSARLIGGVLSALAMVMGYFVFEGFLYGFAPSVVNIPANAVQGVAGIIIGMIVIQVFEKANISLE